MQQKIDAKFRSKIGKQDKDQMNVKADFKQSMPSPTIAGANGKQKTVNLMPVFTEEQNYQLERVIAKSLISGKSKTDDQRKGRKYAHEAQFLMKELLHMNEPPRADYLKKPKIPM